MTISSILNHIDLEKWYNDIGDNMNKVDIIYNFENNLLKQIVQKLEELSLNDLVMQINSNSNKIANSDKLIINEDFDFEIHFEVMLKFIMNYTKYATYSNNQEFYEIVLKDFQLYWQNIKTPKLDF